MKKKKRNKKQETHKTGEIETKPLQTDENETKLQFKQCLMISSVFDDFEPH